MKQVSSKGARKAGMVLLRKLSRVLLTTVVVAVVSFTPGTPGPAGDPPILERGYSESGARWFLSFQFQAEGSNGNKQDASE